MGFPEESVFRGWCLDSALDVLGLSMDSTGEILLS
jgi:hypothetical protein